VKTHERNRNQVAGRERRVLVVEDSPTQAELIRLLLEGDGYRVEVATNGREGLQRVKAGPPDLIISDVVMPEMDGYAFCRAVKSVQATRRIPFVLLTERRTPGDILRGLEGGADNFITKPFEGAYLLERVRRIFENAEVRWKGQMDVEVTLRVGGRELSISVDKAQIIELLFATLEDLDRLNAQLVESQRAVDEYARTLEAKVQERTQQLIQTEKLATMGQLLAGVAHELNNPLSIVMGHVSLLCQGEKGGPVTARAEKIFQAADRCARIVRNFLALARQHPPERQRVLLNEIVRQALELVVYQLRVDSVKVELNLVPELPDLWADPHQLHQVVVNLVTNAHHAMRETSPPRRLTLGTRFDPAQGRIVLEVADTGPGIPPEIQARIFEPFFTTKPPGEGTGLGLSLCQGIIETHGGSIRVASPPGQGTLFVVELPVTVPPPAAPEGPSAEALPPIGGKAILVVDDEPAVTELLADLLSLDGHQVVEAANGLVALDKLRERTYDLILSDIKMPELDGPGFYREVARRHPHLCQRFIFITGDLLSRETREFLEQVPAPNLTKPFALEEVRRVVQRAFRPS